MSRAAGTLGRIACALIACALGTLVADRAFAAAGVPAAISWLTSQQNADGSWGNDRARPRPAVRDTAEGALPIRLNAPHDPLVASALDALAATASGAVDLEARRLHALVSSGAAASLLASSALAALAEARAPDGGWGLARQFRFSDALDTALAAQALARSSAVAFEDWPAAAARLASLQNLDGGYGQAVGEPSEPALSAEVLRGLVALSDVSVVDGIRAPLVHYLAALQNADGGFPAAAGAPSDVTTTALAMRALELAGPDIVT